MKTQTVRLIDVFLLGPLMFYVGAQRNDALGLILAASGIATVLYNGANYITVRDAGLLDTEALRE